MKSVSDNNRTSELDKYMLNNSLILQFHLFVELSGDCFGLMPYDNDEVLSGFKV